MAERIVNDDYIPDYDHLFDENPSTKKKKGNGFLVKMFKLNRRTVFVSSLLYVLQSSPLWIMPLVSANIINIATAAIAVGEITSEIWIELAVNAAILLLSIIQNVPTTVLRLNLVNKMLRRTSAGIKTSVVKKLQSLSITYHKNLQNGKIQSKFIKDTDSVSTLLRLLVNTLIPTVISVVISVFISIYKNGTVALFFLLVIPCNVALTLSFRKKIRAKNKDYRIKNEDTSSKLTTMMEMMPVTKSHGLEQTEISTVRNSIGQLTNSGLDLDRTIAHFGSSTFVVNHILSAVCLLFCTALALYGQIGVGDIVLYQSMFSSISGYVTTLINIIPEIAVGTDAVNSVSEIMNAKDVEINTGKYVVPDIIGEVTFEDVCYKYPNAENFVVNHFNLNVKQGECIAVVGSSGSGKSTLMNIIIGFLKPTSGVLKIDGKSIEELNLSEYRHHISVVPQSSVLFAGSIRDNITYGLLNYKEEDVLKVAEMANLNEFVKDLPQGLDTDIGEHGDKLSGGQKQRVTIARALIRDPRILILDEATSALDNISEYHVQKAIEGSVKGRTTFIVAHRLSTIRGADRIVVMDEGRIAEEGTYEELMEKRGKFYELKNLNELRLKQAESGLS